MSLAAVRSLIGDFAVSHDGYWTKVQYSNVQFFDIGTM